MTSSTGNAPTTPLAPGYKLDRYELLSPIAEGGMASVWAARLRGRHGFEKLVAIKTILPKYASDPRFRRMFLDEADIASRVEHPNVAQVFDLGDKGGTLYLVMEYVDGDSLSKLNRTCQKKFVAIPTGIALRVLADACAGLHEAHELKGSKGEALGVVHRDISPHNVLVSAKGIVKLIDFGIVKLGQADATGNTATGESGVLKGKIQYMAPEQALGRPIDRRADVWAIGAILYHLLAGKSPYEGESQMAMLHVLGAGLPPQPLPPEVHPAIAAVVRKSLSHEPSQRYATASDLRESIERAMVVAQLATTSADVSAFWTQHLAERAQRRRQAIEHALATLADKTRAEAAMAAAALVHPKRALAPSDPPTVTSSYATLGSAALDTSGTATGVAKAKKPLLTLLAFALGFGAVTATSMAVLGPQRSPGGPATASPPAQMAAPTATTAAAAGSFGSAAAAAKPLATSEPSATVESIGVEAPAAVTASSPTPTSSAPSKHRHKAPKTEP